MFFWKKRQKKIGLVLGGGTARGIAHLGVIKVLRQNQIPIDFISGTSIGSIFGALLAANVPTPKIEQHIRNFKWAKVAEFNFPKWGLVSSIGIAHLIEEAINDIKFKDLKIPLSIVATDLLKGKEKVFCDPEMKVEDAVQASCAIPGLFSPVQIGNSFYVDGFIQNNLPISAVKAMGAEKVIAVDVIPDCAIEKPPENIAQVVNRSIDLLTIKSVESSYQQADILLRPVTENINSTDVEIEKLIAMGQKAAQEQLDKIKGL